MRMTNEQFQAEVFRRARAYSEQRQSRRRRVFSGALAFAGCFALILAAARILPIRNNKEHMTANEAAPQADQYTAGGENGDNKRGDSSEAYAEAVYEADGDYLYDDAEESCESYAEDSCAESAEDSDQNSAVAVKSEGTTDCQGSDLYDKLGIRTMPETLAGVELNRTTYAGTQSDRLTVACVYENLQATLLVVMTNQQTDENGSGEIIYTITENGVETAEFDCGNTHIVIESNESALLHTAAEELKQYLSE